MLFQGKSSSRAKSRAQFTPMRTTAADSRTKIVITLDTLCRPNPLFDKQTVDGKPLTKPYGHGVMENSYRVASANLSTLGVAAWGCQRRRIAGGKRYCLFILPENAT
jgi:hypothetical protein